MAEITKAPRTSAPRAAYGCLQRRQHAQRQLVGDLEGPIPAPTTVLLDTFPVEFDVGYYLVRD
jgi:hypothetical protein